MNTFQRLVLKALALLITQHFAHVRETPYAENLVKDLIAASDSQ